MSGQAAVFLDRDGTLMEDADYPRRAGDVRVFEDAREALLRLREAGFLLILVTNQSGIGRGYFSEADYWRVHEEFLRQLAPACLDAAYFCPDPPDADSEDRKPAPGMILRAAREWGVDLSRSWMIGDKPEDVEAGRRAGLRTIQVMTGKGAERPAEDSDCRVDRIGDAAGVVLGIRS